MNQLEYIIAVADKAERLALAAQRYAEIVNQRERYCGDSIWLTNARQRREAFACNEFSMALAAMNE